MKVFSLMQSPFIVPRVTENGGRDLVKIFPGRQKVDDDAWNGIKDHSQVKVRMDRGHLRASQDLSQDLTKRERSQITSTPDFSAIEDLCRKAEPVSDGEIGDGEYELVK